MKKALIIASAILVVSALVICFVPLRDEAYAVTINCTEPVTKYVNLSYEANLYTKTEITEEYQLTSSCGCSGKWVEVEVELGYVNITNTDDVDGEFMLILFGYLDDCVPFSDNITISINASEQKIVEYPTEVIEGWEFEVIPGWKEIETGEFTTKQIEEIQYKKITALEYLLYY